MLGKLTLPIHISLELILDASLWVKSDERETLNWSGDYRTMSRGPGHLQRQLIDLFEKNPKNTFQHCSFANDFFPISKSKKGIEFPFCEPSSSSAKGQL